jgi:hypothetical protein
MNRIDASSAGKCLSASTAPVRYGPRTARKRQDSLRPNELSTARVLRSDQASASTGLTGIRAEVHSSLRDAGIVTASLFNEVSLQISVVARRGHVQFSVSWLAESVRARGVILLFTRPSQRATVTPCAERPRPAIGGCGLKYLRMERKDRTPVAASISPIR